METKKITIKEVQMIISNPFYCMTINPMMCIEHDPMITEDEFIECGVKSIKEIGAKKYLRSLLDNLKGNYI